jgi:hypothetical protein
MGVPGVGLKRIDGAKPRNQAVNVNQHGVVGAVTATLGAVPLGRMPAPVRLGGRCAATGRSAAWIRARLPGSGESWSAATEGARAEYDAAKPSLPGEWSLLPKHIPDGGALRPNCGRR